MLKKIKAILIFMLVVPLMFSITACKDKKDNNNNNTENEQGGENPSGPDNPVDPENAVYTVKYDYNLPERLEGLIADSTVSANVGTDTVLPTSSTLSNARAAQYFLGWKNSEGQSVEGTVTAQKDEVVELKAVWSNGLDRYYYSEGLTFTADTDTEIATVSGYTGTDEVVYLPKYYTYGILDYLVEEIGESAFENSSVKKVKYGIESLVIGNKAFKNSAIEEFDFDGVYKLKEESFFGTKIKEANLGAYLQIFESGVFENCAELTSVDFSKIAISTLTTIPTSAFSGCSKLETVKLNNKITKIETNAFLNCTVLESFNFVEESNVTTILSYAFENCIAFKEITLPNRITSLGSDVFRGCQNIKTVNLGRIYYAQPGDSLTKYLGDLTGSVTEINLLGNTITEIKSYYFMNYVNVTKFVMADSVEFVGDGAFSGCISLADLHLSTGLDVDRFNIATYADTVWYSSLTESLIIENILLYAPSTVAGEVTIKEGVTKISSSSFKDNYGVTKIVIPSSVEFIGQKAFYNCFNLEEVYFAENNKIESINDNTFYNCSKLATINLTNCKALKSINTAAFRNALSVDEFVLPNTIETIAEQAFRNAKVKSFSVGENSKFVTEAGVLYEKNAQGDLVSIVAYPKLKEDTTFVVKASISSIYDYAFNNAQNLKAVYISSTSSGSKSSSFAGAGVLGFLSVYTEDVAFIAKSSQITIYDIVAESNYTVAEGEGCVIELTEGCALQDGDYFAKIVDNNTVTIVSFTVNVSGETPEISSQKVVEEVFNF